MSSSLPIKVGLEIHQQLDTHKLFCNCPSRLVDAVQEEFSRRLRPTQSELGEVDRAALEEAVRDRFFRYQATPTSCLVEADEEPPHEANSDAIETVLQVALLLEASPVEEIHFMRKTVIDGSNTTGFQRTALVAMDGKLEVEGRTLGIPTICLEEDAARVIDRQGKEVVYRLDRLGIPLIEVATTPDIDSPEMAREVALKIGRLLRGTRRVLRGLGTIREDLNVSVKGGARVEIKGVQDLRMIATIVAQEVDRQTALLEASRRLRERGVGSLNADPVDLSAVLEGTESPVLRQAQRRGARILGQRLPGFAGLLEGRLGPEFAAHVAVLGVPGILHSDELPGYGVRPSEVTAIREALGCEEEDGFVVVAAREDVARAAQDRVVARANAARQGVPEETRDARPEGHTVYSRPLPGSARMYPETDVAPIRVSPRWLKVLGDSLPEPPEEKAARLAATYDLHPQQTAQLVDDEWDDLFEHLVGRYENPGIVARTFLNYVPELQAEGFAVEELTPATWEALFAALAEGRFAKEAIPTLIRTVLEERVGVDGALEQLGLQRLSRKELEGEIDRLIEANLPLLRERGPAAAKALMGAAMERLRGRAEGRLIHEVLESRVKARLAGL